jgi:hypothetical protein
VKPRGKSRAKVSENSVVEIALHEKPGENLAEEICEKEHNQRFLRWTFFKTP